MKLISLELTAQGKNGWGSPLLQFGHRTTSLYAKNGSGKTPLVHALAFCLGYPIIFRDDINDKCRSAVLVIEQDKKQITLERFLGKEFAARITISGGKALQYLTDREYSKAIFELLGMEVPGLISTTKQATQPYLSTVLPIFYLNQDTGYSDAYRPYRPFISDQFVEMVRFIFGLAPRHSFDAQKDLIAAKDMLERTTARIIEQQKRVADRASNIDETQDNVDTPKQQEIQTQDLAGYLVAISELVGQANAQLVFSTTEYRFPSEQQDTEWVPTFAGPEQPMYLHPVQSAP